MVINLSHDLPIGSLVVGIMVLENQGPMGGFLNEYYLSKC